MRLLNVSWVCVPFLFLPFTAACVDSELPAEPGDTSAEPGDASAEPGDASAALGAMAAELAAASAELGELAVEPDAPLAGLSAAQLAPADRAAACAADPRCSPAS